MTIDVEKYPDGPIIVATMKEPMDFYKEIPDMFARILELRDTIQDYPMYFTIVDMTGIKADFSEIVFSLSEARKAIQQRRPEFPNSVHLVGSGRLFELASNALAQAQYGEYSAPLHSTMEDALNVVRADINKNQ